MSVAARTPLRPFALLLPAALSMAVLTPVLPVQAGPPLPPPLPPAPTQEILDEDAIARLDWSVPDRFDTVWNSWRPSSSTYDPEMVTPRAWSINLDGCASTAVRKIQTYVFTITQDASGWQRTVSSPSCRVSLNTLPAQGTYKATLTVKTDFNPSVGTSRPVEQDVRIRDYLLVSLGDSMASGEGNPERDGSYKIIFNNITGKATKIGVTRTARWQDERCHRSNRSGPARAARARELADKKTSITFISFACSGAEIANLVSQRYQGIVPKGTSTVPAQVSAVSVQVGPQAGRARRPIDQLSVAVGANDVDFSSILERCAKTPNIGNSSGCVTKGGLAGKIDRLDNRFASLAQALRPINAREIYVSRYPANPLRGAGCEIFGLTRLGISGPESREIYKWGQRLNAKIASAAHRFGSDAYRWNLLPDPTGAFAPHAYCDSPSWFVRYRASWLTQGDENGTIHPNTAGHKTLADQMVASAPLDPHVAAYRRVVVRVTALKAQAAANPRALVNLGVTLYRTQSGLTESRVISIPRSGRWVPVAASRGTFTITMFRPRATPRRPIGLDLRAGGTKVASYGWADNYGAGAHERSFGENRYAIKYTVTSSTP